jgi:hypothetical protein
VRRRPTWNYTHARNRKYSTYVSELYYNWNNNSGLIFEVKMAETEARLIGMIQAPTRKYHWIQYEKSRKIGIISYRNQFHNWASKI